MSTEEKNVPDNLVAKSGIFGGMNVTMGVASMAMILGFVFFTIRDVEYSSAIFSSGKDFIIGTMGWFYVVVVNVALFFVFWLLFSRFGDVKLGKDDDEPDFSTFSWICMLFSAGLGSGLIYWGVAEPMYHIQGNPFLDRQGLEPGSVDAAVNAVAITNFHWGLHGWGLYVLVGLSLAYFSYRHDLPLTLRTALYPVVAYMGPAAAGLISGSFVVETIFFIPGMGPFFVNAALNRDYTMVMGTVLFYATLIILFNLLVDIVQMWMNPRTRND